MRDRTFGSTRSSSNTRLQMAAPAVRGPFLSVAASSLRLDIKHRFTIHRSCLLDVPTVCHNRIAVFKFVSFIACRI